MTIFHVIKYPAPDWFKVTIVEAEQTLPDVLREKFRMQINDYFCEENKDEDDVYIGRRLTIIYESILMEYEDDNISCD